MKLAYSPSLLLKLTSRYFRCWLQIVGVVKRIRGYQRVVLALFAERRRLNRVSRCHAVTVSSLITGATRRPVGEPTSHCLGRRQQSEYFQRSCKSRKRGQRSDSNVAGGRIAEAAGRSVEAPGCALNQR